MINISKEEAELFEKNGFSKEKVKATVEHYRQQGMSDEEIQLKINTQIANFSNTQPQEKQSEKKQGVDLTPSGLLKKYLAGIDAPRRAIEEWKKGNSLESPLVDAYKLNRQDQEQFSADHPVLSGVSDFVTDVGGYAAALPTLGGAGVGTFAANSAIQGGVPFALEALKRGDNPVLGAGAGTGIAAALQGITPPILKGSAAGIEKALNSNFVKNRIPKAIEFLTSVPAEYSQRAIQKELAGDSIFKGKFDNKILNKGYKDAGEKAAKGFKNATYESNAGIEQALNSLPQDSINSGNLVDELVTDINRYSHGGRTNPAIDQKGDDIFEYLKELSNPQNKTVDYHNIKSNIQNQLRNQYGKESGEGINALKEMGATIRDRLNSISPEYARANANRESLYDIKKVLDNINPKTIAGKLRNSETDASIQKGIDEAVEQLDAIVSPQYKFLDNVRDLRAREALEKWFPGQGKGFGSDEGAGNIARVIAAKMGKDLVDNLGGLGRGVRSAITIGSLGTFSPKWMGQGTIKNIGKLSNKAKDILSGAYDKAILKFVPALSKSPTTLYGGVEYNDY